MVSYIAVVFFCFQEQCYFYGGSKPHFTPEACVAEVQKVEETLAQDGIDSRSTCIRLKATGQEV